MAADDTPSFALHQANQLKVHDSMYNAKTIDLGQDCRMERVGPGIIKIHCPRPSAEDHVQSAPVQQPPTTEGCQRLNTRPGFAYYLMEMRAVEGMKIGLCVMHFRNQVIISKVATGSIAAKSLRVLDRIIEVNGIPVTDKDVCTTLIARSIQNTGEACLIVERPVERPAIELMENALSASLQQAPSVTMPSDVKSIVRRHNEKISSGSGEMQPVKILKRPDGAPRYHPHIHIEDMRNEYLIGMDKTKNQRLTKVPRKKSSKQSKRSRKLKPK